MLGRVLVTGSEGFTGRYVCEELRASGWDVWGAGLGPHSNSNRYLQIDLLDAESLASINKIVSPDVVIHLAASSFIAANNSTAFYLINLIGTKNLLEAILAAESPPYHTIIASSANVYGEGAGGAISEDHPTTPSSHYGVSKLAMEHLVTTYMAELGVTITRPFNYSGVGQDERFLLPKIVRHFKARAEVIELGNTYVARDFSDVRDISRIYANLAELPPTRQKINLCSGSCTSLNSVIAKMTELSGHEIRITTNQDLIRKNELRELWGDRSKLNELLGYHHTIPLSETLRWMYAEI